MPVVEREGVEIFYVTEGDPSNPPLLLSHWFMGSYRTWYDIGWVRVLKPHFYLIMPDHRGYGDSTKLYTPADYRPEEHVADMEALLDQLGLERTHFFGYSMGGRIGFAMAAFAPHRLLSLVIGGMHPYESERIPTDLDERIELLKQGMEVTLTAYGIGPDVVFTRMLDNDADALLADSIQTRQWQGLADEVAEFEQPTLLFVGKEDGFLEGVREISQQMKNCRFISFTGENHRTAFLKRTLLLPHLSRFYRISF